MKILIVRNLKILLLKTKEQDFCINSHESRIMVKYAGHSTPQSISSLAARKTKNDILIKSPYFNFH